MDRPEQGFTLTEVLVTIVITGIIAGAVTASIIIGLRTTDATVNRLSDSRDAQLAAAYFGTDVQQADRVETDWPDPMSAACEVGDRAVLNLIDDTVAGPSSMVSYTVRQRGSAEEPIRELRRITCTVDSAGVPLQQLSDLAVADYLDPVDLPELSCSPADCSAAPERVALTVSLRGCSSVASSCRPGIAQPFEYSLLGTRRLS